MKLLKIDAEVEHVWFGDDVFALNQHWVKEFAEEVMKRNATLPFKIQSRADLMSEQTVQSLKAAGCSEVWMGVESGSQAVLKAMDKGLNVSSVIAARRRLKEAGIRACHFLQFGYPGEAWTELQETIAVSTGVQTWANSELKEGWLSSPTATLLVPLFATSMFAQEV